MNTFLADCKHINSEIKKEDKTIYIGCQLFIFKTKTIFWLHIGVYFCSKRKYYMHWRQRPCVPHSYTYLLTIDVNELGNSENKSTTEDQIKSDLKLGIINFNTIEKFIGEHNSKFNKTTVNTLLFQNKLCFVEIPKALDFHIYCTENHEFFKNSHPDSYSYLDEMEKEYDKGFFRNMSFFTSEIKTIILSKSIECFSCRDGDLELLQLGDAVKNCYLSDFKCKKLEINKNLINLCISCISIKSIVFNENFDQFYDYNSQTENVILNTNLEYLDIYETKFESLQLNKSLKECYLNKVGIQNIIVNENLELLNIIEDELYNINIENPKNNTTAKAYISINYKNAQQVTTTII